MKAELIRSVLEGLSDETEVRIVYNRSISLGISKMELVKGTIYLTMDNDQRIIPAKDRDG